MTMEELIAILDDPAYRFISVTNANTPLKQAALRALISVYGIEMKEDGNGNKTLVDKEGNTLKNKNGNPITISAQFLEQMEKAEQAQKWTVKFE